MTLAEVERRHARLTSELLRVSADVRLDVDPNGCSPSIAPRRQRPATATPECGNKVLVRGNSEGVCAAAIYLDGRRLPGITVDELDQWVHPNEIAGIEIYAGPGTPPEYLEGPRGCGSILIWTR
jgi:hypothetical protein